MNILVIDGQGGQLGSQVIKALLARFPDVTITAIGTSQEGADVATIRQIALMCKMTGTDIHHLGDAGYGGMSLPENIQAYSIAVRGIRHTYRRMAGSVNR